MGWKDGIASLLGSAEAVFGSDVTYTPHDAPPAFTVRGIFRAEGSSVDVEAEVEIQDVRPMLDVLLSPAAPEGLGGRMPERKDQVTIDGTVYDVVEWTPDGEGAVAIHLVEELPTV